MAFTNNVMIVRHKLLAQLVRLWNENRLLDEIDRLPLELSPRKSKVIGRCCVHKERAVWKYKSFPLLGFDMSDEVDELTPLSEYAKKALKPEGSLYFEINPMYVNDIVMMLSEKDFHDVASMEDDFGKRRFVKCRR